MRLARASFTPARNGVQQAYAGFHSRAHHQFHRHVGFVEVLLRRSSPSSSPRAMRGSNDGLPGRWWRRARAHGLLMCLEQALHHPTRYGRRTFVPCWSFQRATHAGSWRVPPASLTGPATPTAHNADATHAS